MQDKFLKVSSIMLMVVAGAMGLVCALLILLGLVIFVAAIIQEGGIPNLIGTHAGMVFTAGFLEVLSLGAVGAFFTVGAIFAFRQKRLKLCVIFGAIYLICAIVLIAVLQDVIVIIITPILLVYLIATIRAYNMQRKLQKQDQATRADIGSI